MKLFNIRCFQKRGQWTAPAARDTPVPGGFPRTLTFGSQQVSVAITLQAALQLEQLGREQTTRECAVGAVGSWGTSIEEKLQTAGAKGFWLNPSREKAWEKQHLFVFSESKTTVALRGV